MFDYQAGEKYRLTLVMVALAGLMAGIFFTVLLMPTPEPVRRRPVPKWATHPDVTGRPAMPGPGAGPGAAEAYAAQAPHAAPVVATDPAAAKSLIEQWLPLAWDLSAGTARTSQEKAIAYMTPDCAAAYRQNIWNPELAKQIDESGLKSEFHPSKISVSQAADGSAVVFVEGVQVLGVPGKVQNSRPVSLEYMIRLTAEGLRIAGISEGGMGN